MQKHAKYLSTFNNKAKVIWDNTKTCLRVPVYYSSLHSNKITVDMWRGDVFLHFYRTEDGYLKEKVHLRQNLQLQNLQLHWNDLSAAK